MVVACLIRLQEIVTKSREMQQMVRVAKRIAMSGGVLRVNTGETEGL